MPIAKELLTLPFYPLWKLTPYKSVMGGNKLFSMSLPSEASDYIRKIGEHFISFIHKLDQSGLVEGWDLACYQRYVDSEAQSVSSLWISTIGTYITTVLS